MMRKNQLEKNKNPSTEFNFKHVGILKVFDNNNINILDISLLVGIGALNANDDYFCAIKFKDGVIYANKDN